MKYIEMTTVLAYEPKGEKPDGIGTLIGVAIACGASLYAWQAGYVIAIKRLSLGANSFLIFGILLGLGLVRAIWDYIASIKKASIIAKLTKEEKSITLESDIFSYPILKNGACDIKKIPYDAVTQLRTKTDEDEGESQVVYLDETHQELIGSKWIQWFKFNFPKEEDYRSFKEGMSKKCTKIDNR